MAVLQNIRVKFGLAISIIIALALLSFIIDPTMLESALQSMSSKYNVGVVDGKAISYNDFQEEMDRFTTITEVSTGSSAHSEQVQTQIRNSAWQSFIDKYLFLKNAKAAGITVGKAELADLVSGDMVSPVIAQNYAFCDENGVFSPARLSEFVKSLDNDQSGQMKTYWNYIQNTVYTQQFYIKYGSLFTATAGENALSLRRAIAENNTTADVDFVMVPFGYMPDSTVTVSNAEIKKYYNDHKDFFKQQASRDIEYVVFEVIPSATDIAAANEAIASVYDEFVSTTNMKSFLMKNSSRSLNDYWYRSGELNTVNSEVNDFVFSAKRGAVSPIYTAENDFFAVKVLDEARVADSVYVRHILLQGDKADHVADSLCGVLAARKATFSNLAAEYSVDQNSAADGELGNIGWLTQTYMIPGFEKTITAPVRKPFVIKTQYGTHVVEVSKTSEPMLKKKVAILEKEAVASKETFNEYYSRANKFATLAAGSLDNYLAATDSVGVYSHPMNNVAEGTSTYGSVDNAREVTRWIYDNKAGKVSGIITVNNNFFFVVALKAIHKEGYAPVNEVAAGIRQQLYSQKLGEKKAAEAAEKIAGLTSLEDIAEALGTTVSSQSVAFSSMANQALDPAFIGAVSAAEEGKITGPVAGSIGVYVFQVNSRDVASFYTEDDAENYTAQKNQYNAQMILPVMMNSADVKDNRARFF